MHLSARGMMALGVNVELMYLGDLAQPQNMLKARTVVQKYSRDFDLVHAQFGSACGLVTRSVKKPKVLSLRGSDWHRYMGPDRREARHSMLAHAFSRLSLNHFDAVITMSERMRREVREASGHPFVLTIPDPIDMDLFRPRTREDCRVELYGEADLIPWVLFTTRSTSNPVKRSELALEAVRLARQRIGQLEIKVASGIPYSQMPLFVSACDVALCTSTHEGWPNSLKEGLACGIPFVSTDVSDMAVIAERHPVCRVCPPTPDAIATELCGAIQSQKDYGLPEVVAGMDVNLASRRLLEVYTAALGDR